MAFFRRSSALRSSFRMLQPSTPSPALGRFRFMSGKAQEEDSLPLTETVRDFLNPADFHNLLLKKRMDFFTGVPDSLLKDICAYWSDNVPADKHIMTANEGAAVGVAAGYHLSTGKTPVVYMQNSGFGNTINPLLSLADPRVYSIPMLMLIGWRGEPGKKDEPQHVVQGKVMTAMLTDLGISYEVLPDYMEGAEQAVDQAAHYMKKRNAPYVFLVKRQTFNKYRLQGIEPNVHTINREEALKVILDNIDPWDAIVSTTGFTSREVYELRDARGEDHSRDFLTVGSMGHASAIAMGVALGKPSRKVICIDGDGAALMHMGTFATVGIVKPPNMLHILINNGSHDSVGGQPTSGFDINFREIASASGYKSVHQATTTEGIVAALKEMSKSGGPALLEILVNKGARSDLGRPKTKTVQNKEDFMKFLQE